MAEPLLRELRGRTTTGGEGLSGLRAVSGSLILVRGQEARRLENERCRPVERVVDDRPKFACIMVAPEVYALGSESDT